MKKIIALIMLLFVALIAGNAFGQTSEKSKSDRKGGFATGGYDQSRKAAEPTRSIEVREEAVKSEKSIDFEVEEAVKPDAPAQAVEAKEAPVSREVIGKSKQGNKNSRARSADAKSKQKQKKESKPEGNRR